MSKQPNEAPRSLTLNMLKRANSLAMMLLVVLALTAAALFVILDALGWSSTGVQAMIALLVAPLLLSIVAGGGWLVWRAGENTVSAGVTEGEEDVPNG